MKNLLNLLFLVLLFSFSTSCSKDSIEEITIENIIIPETKPIEIEIMELINTYRLDKGLNALSNHDIVKSQAYSHTDYMVETSDVSHANFFKRRSYLVNEVGAEIVTENVAYGFTSAESVVNAWLNSEGHKENMEGDFTNFDVSAEQNSNGKWYFTNIFIKK